MSNTVIYREKHPRQPFVNRCKELEEVAPSSWFIPSLLPFGYEVVIVIGLLLKQSYNIYIYYIKLLNFGLDTRKIVGKHLTVKYINCNYFNFTIKMFLENKAVWLVKFSNFNSLKVINNDSSMCNNLMLMTICHNYAVRHLAHITSIICMVSKLFIRILFLTTLFP